MTKLILGSKQTSFLIETLQERLDYWRQFRDEQYGDGGPANPRTIRLNVSWANHMIAMTEDILAKMDQPGGR